MNCYWSYAMYVSTLPACMHVCYWTNSPIHKCRMQPKIKLLAYFVDTCRHHQLIATYSTVSRKRIYLLFSRLLWPPPCLTSCYLSLQTKKKLLLPCTHAIFATARAKQSMFPAYFVAAYNPACLDHMQTHDVTLAAHTNRQLNLCQHTIHGHSIELELEATATKT